MSEHNSVLEMVRNKGQKDVPDQTDETIEKCYRHRRQQRQMESTLELVRLKATGQEPHQAERVVFEWYGINPVWMAGPEEIRMKACDAHGSLWMIAIKGTCLFQDVPGRQSLWNTLKSKACFFVQEIGETQALSLEQGHAAVSSITVTEIVEEAAD